MEPNDIKLDTVEKIKIWFTIRFGTYAEDDTVKVADVFKILNEITYKLTGEYR